MTSSSWQMRGRAAVEIGGTDTQDTQDTPRTCLSQSHICIVVCGVQSSQASTRSEERCVQKRWVWVSLTVLYIQTSWCRTKTRLEAQWRGTKSGKHPVRLLRGVLRFLVGAAGVAGVAGFLVCAFATSVYHLAHSTPILTPSCQHL